jgi:hypothetical protein
MTKQFLLLWILSKCQSHVAIANKIPSFAGGKKILNS